MQAFIRHTYHTTSSVASLTGSGSRHFFLPGKLTFPAFLRQYRQGFVFVGLHELAFPRSFIVDAAEVEDTVDDGTVEFLVVGSVEGFGISLHRIEADKQVAGDLIAARVIERDDIRIIIMLEVLAVYFQNLLVGAEDVADIADLLTVCGGNLLYPVADRSLFDCRKLGVFRVECYCHIVVLFVFYLAE